MPEHSHSLGITTQQADGGQIAQQLPPRSEPQSAVSSSLLIFRKRGMRTWTHMNFCIWQVG